MAPEATAPRKRTKRVRAASLVAHQRGQQQRDEESAKLDTLRPHAKTVDELVEFIAEYETAQEQLRADGADLDEDEAADLEQLRTERTEAQSELEKALAALESDEEREKCLGIVRFELAKNRLWAMQNEQDPRIPSKAEIQYAVHRLLDRVDHKLVTQEELTAVAAQPTAKGDGILSDSTFIFCDCPTCAVNEEGERRVWDVPYRAKDGEKKTRKAIGSYFSCDGYEKKGSIRQVVYFAVRTRNRHLWMTRNASPENAAKVLDRVSGRWPVKVEQTFPAREGQPENTTEDYVLFDVEEDGTAVFVEAGHRLAKFFGDAVGLAWEKGEKIGRPEDSQHEKRIGFALLDAAGRLGGSRGDGDSDDDHGTTIGASIDADMVAQLNAVGVHHVSESDPQPKRSRRKAATDEDDGSGAPKRKSTRRRNDEVPPEIENDA